jgi:hypothetical protein
MTPGLLFQRTDIAPCGINCGTCKAYLRPKNKCSGCMSVSGTKVNHCASCSIRHCEMLDKTSSKFCCDCGIFPCSKIKHIDKRYRLRYKTGLIDNLLAIKSTGIDAYLKQEAWRWKCSECGSVLSVHSDCCDKCGKEYTDPHFVRK